MKNILQVAVRDVGENDTTKVPGTIGTVIIVTEGGAIFHISQDGPRTIHLRTPTGRLIIEPVAANVLDIKTEGI
ncbi:MAG: hypothetical protein KAI64_05940 [Thermoplasmata archaeon]|nr:hypothetical protein [Thermoplasmata archaeon]